MAEVDMADSPSTSDSIKPIVLPSRPTCTNCIAWSDELIAVAGGEVVHIISIDSPISRVESVRVNEFIASEIRVEISRQAEFSLGREQSNSLIVSLGWSSPGLGIHRRPVLAILTSNHLLSFWEYTGQVGTWRRTMIINPSLIAKNTDKSRRGGCLINAFSFLPPFGAESFKAKEHFLALIDDQGYFWVAGVAKADTTTTSAWNIEVVLQQLLAPPRELTERTPITIALGLQASAFDIIKVGGWKGFYDGEGSMVMSRTHLHFKRTGYRPHPLGIVSFMLVIESENGQYAVSCRGAGFVKTEPNEFTPEAFTDVIADSASRFDKEYNLQGHYAVRWLGFAKSPDNTMLAACITLHPSAGPEYTQPRSEHSTVLFVPSGEELPGAKLKSTQEDVQLSILRSITRLAENRDTQSVIDNLVIRVAIAAVHSVFSSDTPLVEWANTAADEYDLADDSPPVETCNICHSVDSDSSVISFADGLDAGVCNAGHRFIRCGITLLSIQDPGISKYCTECGRSFLRIEKLERQDGPSLVKSLLEEWDLCPFCQGFFRD